MSFISLFTQKKTAEDCYYEAVDAFTCKDLSRQPYALILGMGGFRTFFTTRVLNRSRNSEKIPGRTFWSFIRGQGIEEV